jgi:hypothetical protein
MISKWNQINGKKQHEPQDSAFHNLIYYGFNATSVKIVAGYFDKLIVKFIWRSNKSKIAHLY